VIGLLRFAGLVGGFVVVVVWVLGGVFVCVIDRCWVWVDSDGAAPGWACGSFRVGMSGLAIRALVVAIAAVGRFFVSVE
jgi:hypothetical protein